MKWMKKIWRSFMEKHIVQHDSGTPRVQPPRDVNVLRSSMSRYFKYNKPGMAYIIEYCPQYEIAIEALRRGGWDIHLELDQSGALFYAVYIQNKKSSAANMQRHFGH